MGISIWQLAIILGIVILLFGTKKLRNMGGDLGSAINSFKKAIKTGEKDADRKSTRLNSSHRCISYAVFCLKKKKKKHGHAGKSG